MKYLKTLGEIKLNEGRQGPDTQLERSILKSMKLSEHSSIISYDLYPLDSGLEKKEIDGHTILIKLNDDASVYYRIMK